MEDREVWGTGSFAGYVHDHVTRTIGQLDVKAQILAGLATGSLAFEFDRLSALKVLSGLRVRELVMLQDAALHAALSLIPLGLLLIGFTCALTSLRVRMGESKEGILFFVGIAAHQNGKAYAAKAAGVSEAELIQEVLTDAYELARIAKYKAAWAVRGTSWVSAGLAILVGHLFVNALLLPN